MVGLPWELKLLLNNLEESEIIRLDSILLLRLSTFYLIPAINDFSASIEGKTLFYSEYEKSSNYLSSRSLIMLVQFLKFELSYLFILISISELMFSNEFLYSLASLYFYSFLKSFIN